MEDILHFHPAEGQKMIQAPFGIQFQGLVDDLKKLNLLMRVPKAKQFRIDEAKAKSIMCDAPFLEGQGFLDEGNHNGAPLATFPLEAIRPYKRYIQNRPSPPSQILKQQVANLRNL
ncbi:hypothetical protein E4U60_002238 [Claviceps pazoutovae]|uniref:Uncharacterized protein n=1 Tax=Claviceps pazoutovae TaxID=1649127 RepID=A0A9P7SK24_9HYPO|nr:hypothetical protein E4U60_002238 [Claviceps pazoutovae]